jgi:hypothetical protein
MVIVAVTVLVYLLLYCAFRNYSIVYCRRELCIVLDLAFTAIALVTVLSICCWLLTDKTVLYCLFILSTRFRSNSLFSTYVGLYSLMNNKFSSMNISRTASQH